MIAATSKKPPILVCFALKEEAAPFKKIVKGNNTIDVLITGIGKHNAETAVRGYFGAQLPTLVLTCGFAGALDPHLQLNDVLYEADNGSELASHLNRFGAKPAHFHCSSRMIVAPEEKSKLYLNTKADAVEMESAHIRAVCNEFGVPTAVIRVISDTAHEKFPLDFNTVMSKDNALDFKLLLLAILKSPAIIPNLIALQRQTREAARKLARVLDLLQTTLSC